MKVNKILYHATYTCHVASIMEHGLGAKQLKNWEDSEDGVVCLCDDPDAAASFCEVADDIPEEVYDSGISVLHIDAYGLELTPDTNIIPDENDDELHHFTYCGIIPTSHIALIENGY